MNISECSNMLKHLDPNMGRSEWFNVGCGIKDEFGDDAYDLFDSWSSNGSSYDPDDTRAMWDSIYPGGGVTIGTAIILAQANGYQLPSANPVNGQTVTSGTDLLAIWNNAYPASDDHPYIQTKGIGTIGTYGLRQSGDELFVPYFNVDGQLVGIERILSDGGKKSVKGSQRKEAFFPIKDRDEIVVVCEGVATAISIHKAMQCQVLAAGAKSNLKAGAKLSRKMRPDSKIIVAGDVGSEKEAIEAAKAIDGYVAFPSLDQHAADFNDLHQEKGLNVVKTELEECKNAWDVLPFDNQLEPVKSLEKGMLPDAFADWVFDVADRIQCDPGFVAVTALVVASSLIGRKLRIYPKQFDDWIVVVNLWGAIIGRPSAKKTPAMNEVLSILRKIEQKSRSQYESQMKQYAVDKLQSDAEKKRLESELKVASDPQDIAKAKQSLLNHQSVKEPEKRDFIVNDATVEKLIELLVVNDNGLLQYRDELTGFLRSLDREDKAQDRSFYLEAFNGNGSYKQDRIGRGEVYCEHAIISIVGGIQPSKLEPYIWNAQNNHNADGLLQRFQLMIYPDEIQKVKFVDRKPDNLALQKAEEAFSFLANLDYQKYPIRFSEDAQLVFNDWYLKNERRIKLDDLPEALQSHFGKYSSLLPSLALIIDLLDSREVRSVSVGSLKKALFLMDYLETHIYRIYGSIIHPAFNVCKKIIRKRKDLPNGFSARDLKRKHWEGIPEKYVDEALELLIDHNYLVEVKVGKAVTFRWNPKL